jgi:serine/threonine protein kinase
MTTYAIADTVAESQSTLVCRAHRRATGEPVVLKILKPAAGTKSKRARLRHEFDVLSRLSLPGIARANALEEGEQGTVLALGDIGGQSLDRLLARGPLAPVPALELALALTRAVASIHDRHIVHRDINPSHIIVNTATKQLNLIGFGLSQELPDQGVAALPCSSVEGTLAYVSPEQTGRMNRTVDYRTDLYTLGVTLYQMLTGRLPFEAEDDLGMLYSHVAKTPVPPHQIKADVPAMVSAIVMKLMSKMADDRYQSADGLEADLARCLRELSTEGTIRDFDLGLLDSSQRVRFPESLHGRQEELARLLQALDRTTRSERVMFLVGGYAGVGKTRLVRELQKTVLEKHGHFVEGKFDPLQRNVPYLAWIQSFEALQPSVDEERGRSRTMASENSARPREHRPGLDRRHPKSRARRRTSAAGSRAGRRGIPESIQLRVPGIREGRCR